MDKMELRQCPAHDSPLKYIKISSKCDACYEDHHDNKQGYKCNFCEFYLHEECVNVKIPSRHKHPLILKLIKMYDQELCCLCGTDRIPQILYQCSKCSFRICIPCARKPLIFEQTKAHEHKLLQVPMKLPFTCDACGLCSTEYPCLCLQCCFVIHRACIFLPRVIKINRHDHRISHVSSLGPGKWICKVCYEHVNGEYGAYSCLVCSYVFHSKCATTCLTIWDRRELEGVPEEDEIEESKPFIVIDQNLIKHFSHEHNLKASLSSLRLEEPREHCYACTLPFYSEFCYKCTQCDFILHDACANLPLKKRHQISPQILTLCNKGQFGVGFANLFICFACGRYCTGFSYIKHYFHLYITIDVRCASISDAYKHESHPHTLFVILVDNTAGTKCEGCDLALMLLLRCKGKDDCGGYNLCFTCATLPTLVRHRYDDHPLSLCYGEKNVNVTYCCGICEEEVYSKNWFYKCNDCSSTLHTKCVIKNLIHSRIGDSLVLGDKGSFDLLPNNRLSRPICYICKTRCMGDLVLNDKADTSIFICCFCGFSKNFLGKPRFLRG